MGNLVTAVIVEGALSMTAKDREMQRFQQTQRIRHLTPIIKRLFEDLDWQGYGHIGRAAMESVDYLTVPEELREHLTMNSMKDLFEMLDVDGSGRVDETEFSEGLMNLCLENNDQQTILL